MSKRKVIPLNVSLNRMFVDIGYNLKDGEALKFYIFHNDKEGDTYTDGKEIFFMVNMGTTITVEMDNHEDKAFRLVENTEMWLDKPSLKILPVKAMKWNDDEHKDTKQISSVELKQMLQKHIDRSSNSLPWKFDEIKVKVN